MPHRRARLGGFEGPRSPVRLGDPQVVGNVGVWSWFGGRANLVRDTTEESRHRMHTHNSASSIDEGLGTAGGKKSSAMQWIPVEEGGNKYTLAVKTIVALALPKI